MSEPHPEINNFGQVTRFYNEKLVTDVNNSLSLIRGSVKSPRFQD